MMHIQTRQRRFIPRIFNAIYNLISNEVMLYRCSYICTFPGAYIISDNDLIRMGRNISHDVFLSRKWVEFEINDLLHNKNIPKMDVINHYMYSEKLSWGLASLLINTNDYLYNPDLLWVNEKILINTNIPFKYIKDSLSYYKKLKNDNLLDNSYIRIISSKVCPETIHDFMKIINLDEDVLSANTNIPVKFIIDNPTMFRWNWYIITERATIYEITHYDGDWNWNYISSMRQIPFSFILKNLDKSLNWKKISKYFPLTYMLEYPHLEWNYIDASYNSTLEIKHILHNEKADWCWNKLSEVIPITYIEKYNYLPWNFSNVSENYSLTIEFVERNIDRNWDFNAISKNLDPIELMNSSIIELVNKKGISLNPMITSDFIENNKDIFIPNYLANNYFYDSIKFDSLYYKKELAKKVMNAVINNNDYISKVHNPKRRLCVESIQDIESFAIENGWEKDEYINAIINTKDYIITI